MIFGPIKLILRLFSLFMTVLVLYFAVTFVQIWWRGHEHSSATSRFKSTFLISIEQIY